MLNKYWKNKINHYKEHHKKEVFIVAVIIIIAYILQEINNMPMKKAMPGGKIVNKGKYKHGGKVHRNKKGHGGVMTIVIKKDKTKKK